MTTNGKGNRPQTAKMKTEMDLNKKLPKEVPNALRPGIEAGEHPHGTSRDFCRHGKNKSAETGPK